MQASTFLGMENRVLLSADETEGAVAVIDISIEPGAGVPLHTNTREALLWYVIDGTLNFETEEGPEQLADGQTSFFPKGHKQTFVNASDRRVRALLVCIPGGFEGFLLELSGKLPAEVPAGPPPRDALETIVRTAERYGQEIHLEDSPS